MKAAIICVLALGLFVCACNGSKRHPETAYDPALIELAREAQEEQKQQREQIKEEVKKERGECSRDGGGCQAGWICWDSWYCKDGFEGQCSAAGDKRCHKMCVSDDDCPEEMPICKEIPIFKGSERGSLEKFCVAKGQ